MSTTKQLLGNCQHCSGQVQFPAESIGQTADCPHCGQPTELMLAMPEATSSLPKRQIIYGAVVVVILIGGLAGVMIALKRAQRMAASQRQIIEASQPAAPADPFTRAGFQTSQVTLGKAQGSTLVHAIGTIKNVSGKKKFGVKIEIELRDAQNLLAGTATDYQQSLEPGSEWKFRALVTNPKATSATIKAIKEDQ